MAILSGEAYVLPELVWDGDFRSSEHMMAMQALQNVSDRLPLGEVVGAILSWQRGDGYAYYLVIDDEPLTVQFIPFLDKWTVEDELIKGIDREGVIQHLRADRLTRSLFIDK